MDVQAKGAVTSGGGPAPSVNAGTNADETVSRRGLLARAAAVLAGAVATLALPSVAEAADGDYLQVNQHKLQDGTSGTGVYTSGDSIKGGFAKYNSGVYGSSESGYGVRGDTSHASYAGVLGWSLYGHGVKGQATNNGVGVLGESAGTNTAGVKGHATGTGSRGVYGYSDAALGGGAGVEGYAKSGNGVYGWTGGARMTGVLGEHKSGGTGVFGRSGSGQGLYGVSTTGTGVRAVSPSGAALDVQGIAKFTQSGRATISSGLRERLVNGAKVGTGSAILVTPNGDLGSGVYVKYAVRTGATQFKIVFSKATTKAGTCSWFVLN